MQNVKMQVHWKDDKEHKNIYIEVSFGKWQKI